MTKFENDNDRINFVDDWNTMVTAVAHFSEKHGLPKGELIFPPIVLDHLRDVSREDLLPTFVAQGVRTRFGSFEQVDAFRIY